uniref:Acylamino-acid-releasing enzyme n=1 Tax=Pycnococcus provasolii TaxID=41880 RepID=A0A7S2YZT9_9CHLO
MPAAAAANSPHAFLRKLAKLPTPTSAWFTPRSPSFHVHLTQKDLHANIQRGFIRSFDARSLSPLGIPRPVEQDAALVAVSPHNTTVVLKKNEKKSHTVEIWDAEYGRTHVTEIPETVHGTVHAATTFESNAFSSCAKMFVYTAEAPKCKPTKHVGNPQEIPRSSEDSSNNNDSSSSSSSSALLTWDSTRQYEQTWGEASGGAVKPTLFTLNLEDGTVNRVQGIPDGVAVGQATFTPDDKALVCTAWDDTSKLGITFCFNRQSRLLLVPLGSQDSQGSQGSHQILSPTIPSALSPAFSPDGKRLVFLSHADTLASGVHMSDATLHTMPWPPKDDATITKVPIHGATEYLYMTGRLKTEVNFVTPNRIVVTSILRSCIALLDIDLTSGETSIVPPCDDNEVLAAPKNSDDLAQCESSLLASDGDGTWLVRLSDPLSPPILAKLTLDDASWTWQILTKPSPDVPPPKGAYWGCISLPGEEESLVVGSSVVLRPAADVEVKGVILLPHGGPHTTSTAQFFASTRLFLEMGYAVILANYRGSLGFGRQLQMQLPGNVGRLDVRDCVAALESGMKKMDIDDALPKAIFGGSHGGFLGAHLVGQHADLFKAAILRNPVTNLVSMASTTDIPDWCCVEAFGKPADVEQQPSARMGDGSFPPSPEALARLHEVSPIAHVDNVKTPILLLLGSGDERVPVEQGLQYRRALAMRGQDVETYQYDGEGHSLAKPQTEFECLSHTIRFLDEKM